MTASAHFPSSAGSVAEARRYVREVLTDWQVPELADDAVLATSELATNAVAYAGTAFEVRCRLEDDDLQIEVCDHHPLRRPAMPGLEASGGRGLPSVARLATAWGVNYDRTTKGIWFRLSRGATGPAPLPVDFTVSAAPPVEARRSRADMAVDAVAGTVDAVRDLLSADGAAVLLAERDGRLTLEASAGLPADVPTTQLTMGGAGDIGGTPWVWRDGADRPLATAMRAGSLVGAPLQAQGRLIGLLVATAAEPGRFEESDGSRIARIADEMALTLERARLGELERSWRGWLSFVAEASDLLAGTLDQERTMALVAQLVVPRLATWCAVYTVDDTGTAGPSYVWHTDENKSDGLRGLLDHLPPGPPIEVPGPWPAWSAAPESARETAGPIADDTVYGFPMVARGRRIGMIVIGRPAGDHFPRGALDLAEELSRRAALAVDNARLYSAQTAMSQALQRSLLPPDIPAIPGLEVAVVYEPAGEGSEVGGDFYDVFSCAPDPTTGRPTWRFAIGDVCGTGPAAAAVTGLARQAMRILAAEGMRVPAVLARLNALILGEGARSRLLTLLHGEITPRPGADGMRIAMVSAGHPPPLVLDPDGRVREVGTPQPLLGVFDEVDFTADTIELHRGQVLLCVTDGVTERRAGNRLLGDAQGLERLLAECAGLSAGAVAAHIQRAVRDYGPEPSGDDVALIVLRVS
ncbi:protein serine phosphatase [Actinomadura craniellae]|uniref:Protein serine phosphatase n=1 Tax=Actinomadura craniellae TaxID=2231787 RepID=A0A365HBR3_9ACTN|nr:protein serine phosphatase [Actinomadura craniellae]